jgi:hypothetical protein
MNPRIDISAPLEIEITEEEILADLLYPAPLPSQTVVTSPRPAQRNGRRGSRRNGRPEDHGRNRLWNRSAA